MKCFLCYRESKHRHHIWLGRGIRPVADMYELWINICMDCHIMIHKDKRFWQKTICNKLNLDFYYINRIIKKPVKLWSSAEIIYMTGIKEIMRLEHKGDV